jgi:hypothetical protein
VYNLLQIADEPCNTLWQIDPFLGNDREKKNNETTAVPRQRTARKNGSTVRSDAFCVVCSEAISRDRLSECSAFELSEVEQIG